MRLFGVLLLSAVGGLAAHSTRQLLNKYFHVETYKVLTSYAIGVVLLQPFSLMIRNFLPGKDDDMSGPERHLISNLLAALFFGSGVWLGHVSDSICGAKE